MPSPSEAIGGLCPPPMCGPNIFHPPKNYVSWPFGRPSRPSKGLFVETQCIASLPKNRFRPIFIPVFRHAQKIQNSQYPLKTRPCRDVAGQRLIRNPAKGNGQRLIRNPAKGNGQRLI